VTDPLTDLVDGDEPRITVPRFVRLLATEFQRLFARRFFRVVAVLVVLGFLAAVVALFVRHARVTPAELAAATIKRDAQIAEIVQSIKQCATGVPPEQIEQQCGPVPSADQFPPDQFLSVHPLEPGQLSDYALAIGVAVALTCFVLGATFIGAEWSSKNLVAWLFWEPRRLRLMLAKLLALLSVALAAAVLAQLAFYGIGHLLLHYRGLPVSSLGAGAKHFWSHLMKAQLRAVLLVVPTSLLGFGLASLMRNTAASFGVGFVYFAVVESLIRQLNPDWQPYLFTTNIGAWVSNDGLTVFGREMFDSRQGFVAARQIHVSNLHGAVALMLYAGIVVCAALVVFRRRDIS
jgi:ABC-2 type transport system permease protein